MAVLNLDASEPYTAAPASGDGSALFPDTPIYARANTRKTSSKPNLPLLIGAPVAVVAIGALTWGLMNRPAQTPTTDAAPAQVATAAPTTPLPETSPAAAMPAPAEATPAPTQMAKADTAPPPRVTTTTTRKTTVTHKAPVARAQSADSASADVSATVPAPTPAPAAPPPVIAAPAALVPAPAPVAPTPVAPTTPDAPM